MQSQENSHTPYQLALMESMASANVVALIDESLLILSQKRQTLEEKVILRYFHRLACVYAGIISLLHTGSSSDSFQPEVAEPLNRLRIVNENVRNCVKELLKILKYDFNYLEQYFEHDYCAGLLNNQELLGALEEVHLRLQAELSGKSSGI